MTGQNRRRAFQVTALVVIIFAVPIYGDLVNIAAGIRIESLTLGIAGGAIVALVNRILDWCNPRRAAPCAGCCGGVPWG